MAKKTENKTTTIKHDLHDQMCFDDIKETSRSVSELCEKSEGLVQDVFNSFFKMSPELADGLSSPQASIMKQLMSMPEYKNLHASTKMDDIASAFGVGRFAPDFVKKAEEVQKKAEQAKKSGKKSDGTPVPEQGDGQGEPSMEDLLTDDEMSGLRQTIRNSAQKAQESADEWSDASAGWGLDKGELERVPFQQKFDLAQKIVNTKNLKKIAEIAGRFKNIVNTEVSKSLTHGVDEIVDVTSGNDIQRLLPVELMKLKTNPAQFVLDYVSCNLLQYNLKGVEELGKGPIVACVDISGSMQGDRDDWAKAVTLALMNLAEKQKRDFGFIAFESFVQKSVYFRKEKPATIQDKIEIASVRTSGGTNFYPPLIDAFNQIKASPNLKPADIIFITDGDSGLDPYQIEEIKNLKKETGVRIYGIAINDGMYGSRGDSLESFCDQIAVCNNLGEIDIVSKMIKAAAADAPKTKSA